ncbi:hypothetical protein AYO43_04755 [Nitrospira sp. SCGC AG-212-E16]|nr:hypothetical protein AYO43_04755 [Nitrospira sp. SCGC AG-212-E16]
MVPQHGGVTGGDEHQRLTTETDSARQFVWQHREHSLHYLQIEALQKGVASAILAEARGRARIWPSDDPSVQVFQPADGAAPQGATSDQHECANAGVSPEGVSPAVCAHFVFHVFGNKSPASTYLECITARTFMNQRAREPRCTTRTSSIRLTQPHRPRGTGSPMRPSTLLPVCRRGDGDSADHDPLRPANSLMYWLVQFFHPWAESAVSAQCGRRRNLARFAWRQGRRRVQAIQPPPRILEQGLDAEAGSARGRCALIAGGGAERVTNHGFIIRGDDLEREWESLMSLAPCEPTGSSFLLPTRSRFQVQLNRTLFSSPFALQGEVYLMRKMV